MCVSLQLFVRWYKRKHSSIRHRIHQSDLLACCGAPPRQPNPDIVPLAQPLVLQFVSPNSPKFAEIERLMSSGITIIRRRPISTLISPSSLQMPNLKSTVSPTGRATSVNHQGREASWGCVSSRGSLSSQSCNSTPLPRRTTVSPALRMVFGTQTSTKHCTKSAPPRNRIPLGGGCIPRRGVLTGAQDARFLHIVSDVRPHPSDNSMWMKTVTAPTARRSACRQPLLVLIRHALLIQHAQMMVCCFMLRVAPRVGKIGNGASSRSGIFTRILRLTQCHWHWGDDLFKKDKTSFRRPRHYSRWNSFLFFILGLSSK